MAGLTSSSVLTYWLVSTPVAIVSYALNILKNTFVTCCDFFPLICHFPFHFLCDDVCHTEAKNVNSVKSIILSLGVSDLVITQNTPLLTPTTVTPQR